MGDIKELSKTLPETSTASQSGYHIAEAGANPITQLAFTLANGFTFVETIGLAAAPDDFARNLCSSLVTLMLNMRIGESHVNLGNCDEAHYGANAQSNAQISHPNIHRCCMLGTDLTTSERHHRHFMRLPTTVTLHTNAYDEAITTRPKTLFAERLPSNDHQP